MPDHELEGIKFTVKDLMPFADHVITGKDEDIAGGREYPFEFVEKFNRGKLF
jgi:hypothetical protein